MRHFFLIVIFAAGFARAQQCSRYFTGEFVPAGQNKTDSIYYFISLGHFYELHANRAYRDIYSIRWRSECEFDLIKGKTSLRTLKPEPRPDLKCKIVIDKDTVINIETFSGDKQQAVKLKRHNGTPVTELMFLRDPDLKASLENQKKQLSSITDAAQYDALMEQLKQKLLKTVNAPESDLVLIQDAFNFLKTGDGKKFSGSLARPLKELMTAEQAANYYDYLKNVYGKPEYFIVYSQTAGIYSTNRSKPELYKYDFNMKFENCPEEMRLLLTLLNEKDSTTKTSRKTIDQIALYPPKTFKPKFVDEITEDFFKHISSGKLKAVYSDADEVFKKQKTEEEMVKVLSALEGLKEFELESQEFEFGKTGGLIKLVYLVNSSTGKNYLTLRYIKRGKKYLLADAVIGTP